MLLLVRFLDESTGFLAPASVEDFRDDLGIGYGTAAAMFATYGLGGVLGNLVVAATDGRSRKPVTVGGALVTALALALIGVSTEGWMLLAGTGLIAVGSTGLVHGGEIALTNLLAADGRDDQLERVLARGNLGGVVGDLVAPLALAGLRLAGLDWRWVFAGAAVGVVGYAIALAPVRFPEPVKAPGGPGRSVVPVRRQRLVWLLGLGAFAAMPLDEAYLATVLAYAEAVVGWSGAGAAALGAAFVAGGVLAFTTLPPLVGRTPLHRVMTVTGIGLSAVMFAAAVGPGWLLVPIGVVHSVLLNVLWLGEQAVVLRANPGREGRTKLIVEVLEGSSLLVVYAIGVLADRAGLRAAMVAFAAVPLLLPVVATQVRRGSARP